MSLPSVSIAQSNPEVNAQEEALFNVQVKGELATWLTTWHWDWFMTGTFRESYSVQAARRAWERWTRHICWGGWFVAFELTNRNGKAVPHVHALVNCDASANLGPGRAAAWDPYDSKAWQGWLKSYGRCKIERYDPERGAAEYVSKYVTKSAYDRGDWSVGGQWQGNSAGNAGERPVTGALPLASALRPL